MESIANKQKGFVSFITVTFLAGILLLITIGFVRAMTSNGRQTLDSQLNLQAFYAAESGINDIMRKLPLTGAAASNYGSTDCNAVIDNVLSGKNILDSATPVKYSCLLVNSKVDEIKTNPETGKGKMYRLKLAGGGAVDNIHISWGKSTQSKLYSAGTSFTSWIDANTLPVLRATIFYPGTTFNRTNLINSQKTMFLVPNAAGTINTITPGLNDDAGIYSVQCDTSAGAIQYRCNLKIDIKTMVPNIATRKDGIYIRIRPIYSNTDVKIDGIADPDSGAQLVDAQYDIDVTGRANDVYKRINVRKDIFPDFDFPEYVTKTSESICKQFLIWPALGGNPAGDSDPSDCSLN